MSGLDAGFDDDCADEDKQPVLPGRLDRETLDRFFATPVYAEIRSLMVSEVVLSVEFIPFAASSSFFSSFISRQIGDLCIDKASRPRSLRSGDENFCEEVRQGEEARPCP